MLGKGSRKLRLNDHTCNGRAWGPVYSPFGIKMEMFPKVNDGDKTYFERVP